MPVPYGRSPEYLLAALNMIIAHDENMHSRLLEVLSFGSCLSMFRAVTEVICSFGRWSISREEGIGVSKMDVANTVQLLNHHLLLLKFVLSEI